MNSYGGKTVFESDDFSLSFESSVNSYGGKTSSACCKNGFCLRVV